MFVPFLCLKDTPSKVIKNKILIKLKNKQQQQQPQLT